jgi:neutral ceramidase
MKVGAARAEITPPLGHRMEGFESRTSGAIGVHDPLMVRVIAAEGDDGVGVAIVVADLIQIDPHLQGIIAAEVERRTGIVRTNLQLAGTHTHSGPMLREPSDVEAAIGLTIAETVEQAWRARRDAVAAVGIGHVDGIGGNRRPNGGPVDDRVTVTRIDAADGSPIATHVNYGCHPTTLGPNNTLYTADYPGVVCRTVEGEVGGIAVFSTGPQGDVNPGGYSPEGSMVGVVVPWRTFESADLYGRKIAAVATQVRAGLAPQASARVWADSREIGLARKALPEPTAARAAAIAAIAASDAVRAAGLSADATYHAAVAAAYADLIAGQAEDPERDGPVRIRISAIAIGPLLHVGVGGELFVALGQEIRERLGAARTCVAALCDGTIGYIPTKDAFEIGGYEPNASVLQPGEGERLVASVVELAGAAPAA